MTFAYIFSSLRVSSRVKGVGGRGGRKELLSLLYPHPQTRELARRLVMSSLRPDKDGQNMAVLTDSACNLLSPIFSLL